MTTLKSIGVGAAAKMAGALYAVMGFLGGCIFASMALAGANVAGESAFLGAIFGIGAIFALPIFYGTLGLLVGALGALVYNWIAGMVGGFEIELE